MRRLVPSLLASLAVLQPLPANAENARLYCTFEADSTPATDKVAREWQRAKTFQEIELVLDFAANSVVSPAADDVLWGTPSLDIDDKEVRVTWVLRLKPMSRRSVLDLTVNRYTGKAYQIFASQEPEGHGPEYGRWGRDGTCIAKRIF